jgi:hypothetical protein
MVAREEPMVLVGTEWKGVLVLGFSVMAPTQVVPPVGIVLNLSRNPRTLVGVVETEEVGVVRRSTVGLVVVVVVVAWPQVVVVGIVVVVPVNGAVIKVVVVVVPIIMVPIHQVLYVQPVPRMGM